MDINEDKAENTPAGGVLVGKKDGQTIIHDKGTMSGYLVGKLHKDGGIKAVNKATGQPLEMQGGEVIITAPAVSDQTKREFEGKMMTNREILSAINEKGGGVSFANGGDIPAKIHTNDCEYKLGGKVVKDTDIAHSLGMNSTLKKGKQQFSSGDTTYDVDAIYNAIKKGKLRLKTKEVETFPMKYPVYDKKYSETVKTDFRKPNGITVRTESGEEVLIDGNHRMNNAYLKGRKTMKTYYIEDPKQIAKFTKKNKFELGGETMVEEIDEEIDEDYSKNFTSEKFSSIYYREQTGNILMAKNKIYFWVYDIPNVTQKLNSEEFDYLFFPMVRNFGQFDKGFVPPLKQVFTKKYEKTNKGAEHLIGIVEAFFDEKENKLYVQMMTVRPIFRRKGLNSYMIKSIREDLGLSKEDVVFVKTTDEGKKFEESGKFKDGGHLSSGKSLKQIAEMHNVSLAHINEELAKGLEVEKEHFADFKERTRVAKDHLVENPNYYTILEKAGLKNGGHILSHHRHSDNLVKDSKSGNTPARDLNNYNDVMDLEADGMVGMESGLAYAKGGQVSNFFKKTYGNLVEKQGIITTKTDWFNKDGVKVLEYGFDPYRYEKGNTLFFYSWDYDDSGMDYDDFKEQLVDFFKKTYKKDVSELKALYVGWDRKEKDTYADGGITPYDANLEGDSVDIVESDFAKGGVVYDTTKPKLEKVTIKESKYGRESIVGRNASNVKELQDIIIDYVRKSTDEVDWIKFYVNDATRGSYYIDLNKGKKNTVKNVNTETVNAQNIKRVIDAKDYLVKNYDWTDFFELGSQTTATSSKGTTHNKVKSLIFKWKESGMPTEEKLVESTEELYNLLKEAYGLNLEDLSVQPLGYQLAIKPKPFLSDGIKKLVLDYSSDLAIKNINKYLYELFPDLNFDKLVRNSSNAPTTSTKTPLTKEELYNSRIWIGDNVELRDKVIAKLEEIGIPFDKYSGNAVADESIDINIFSNDFVVYKESKEEFDKDTKRKEIFLEDLGIDVTTMGVAPITSNASTSAKPFDFSMTKIDVSNNPDLSLRVQKKAFEDGWEWENGGGKNTKNDPFNYMYFTKTSILFGNTYSSFINSPKREITEAEIFGSQATASQTPTSSQVVEQIEVKFLDKDGKTIISSLTYDAKELYEKLADLRQNGFGDVSVTPLGKNVVSKSKYIPISNNIWEYNLYTLNKDEGRLYTMNNISADFPDLDFSKFRVLKSLNPISKKPIIEYVTVKDKLLFPYGQNVYKGSGLLPLFKSIYENSLNKFAEVELDVVVNGIPNNLPFNLKLVDVVGYDWQINPMEITEELLEERIRIDWLPEYDWETYFHTPQVDFIKVFTVENSKFLGEYSNVSDFLSDISTANFDYEQLLIQVNGITTNYSNEFLYVNQGAKVPNIDTNNDFYENVIEDFEHIYPTYDWSKFGFSYMNSYGANEVMYFKLLYGSKAIFCNNSDELFNALSDAERLSNVNNKPTLCRVYTIQENENGYTYDRNDTINVEDGFIAGLAENYGIGYLKKWVEHLFSWANEFLVNKFFEQKAQATATEKEKVRFLGAYVEVVSMSNDKVRTVTDLMNYIEGVINNNKIEFISGNKLRVLLYLNGLKSNSPYVITLGENLSCTTCFDILTDGKERIKEIIFSYAGVEEFDWSDFFEEAQTPTSNSVVPKIVETEVYDLSSAVNKLEKASSSVVTEYNKDIYDQSLKFLYDTKATYELALKFTPESAFMYERLDILKKLADIEKKIKNIEDMKKGGTFYMLAKILEKLERGENWKMLEQSQDVITNQIPQSEIDVIIRSQKFKNWFGDWEKALINDEYDNVSKALTEGIPTVYHHGARRIKYTYREVSNGVLYLAENISYAVWFSQNATAQSEEGNYLTECFVNIKNPIDLTAFKVNKVDLGDIVRYVDAVYPMAKIYDYIPAQVALLIKTNQPTNVRMWAWQLIRSYAKFVNHIKENTAYDGFLYYENNPSDEVVNPATGQLEENVTKAVAIFKSHQVKVVDAVLFDGGLDDWRFENGGKIKN